MVTPWAAAACWMSCMSARARATRAGSAQMRSVVRPPAAMARPLKGTFQTSLCQRAEGTSSVSWMRRWAELKVSARRRVRSVAGPENSPRTM